MYGPPGTGKTLLARAVAHHTDCQFIRVSGAELVQKYIGEGSRMVRELFVMARCVVMSLDLSSVAVGDSVWCLQRECAIHHFHG
jgi:SpoVK/Ycf46/Vps4 family AAA+-type ATPase